VRDQRLAQQNDDQYENQAGLRGRDTGFAARKGQSAHILLQQIGRYEQRRGDHPIRAAGPLIGQSTGQGSQRHDHQEDQVHAVHQPFHGQAGGIDAFAGAKHLQMAYGQGVLDAGKYEAARCPENEAAILVGRDEADQQQIDAEVQQRPDGLLEG